MMASVFRSGYSTPTQEQFALLGRLVADWSLIDSLHVRVLARLALAPDFTTLAMVDGLAFPRRLEAGKHLIEMHNIRYSYSILPQETVERAAAVLERVGALKGNRNDAAHRMWMRSDDDTLFWWKDRGRQMTQGREDAGLLRVEELQTQVAALEPIIDLLEALLGVLPEISEQALVDRAKHRPKD